MFPQKHSVLRLDIEVYQLFLMTKHNQDWDEICSLCQHCFSNLGQEEWFPILRNKYLQLRSLRIKYITVWSKQMSTNPVEFCYRGTGNHSVNRTYCFLEIPHSALIFNLMNCKDMFISSILKIEIIFTILQSRDFASFVNNLIFLLTYFFLFIC